MVTIINSEEIEHIDDVFYRKSFDIPKGNYEVIDHNAEKIKAKGQVEKIEKLKIIPNKTQNKSNTIKQIKISEKKITNKGKVKINSNQNELEEKEKTDIEMKK